MRKFYFFTNWVVLKTISKFTLKFSLKQLRHIWMLQLHHHGTNVKIIRDIFPQKNPKQFPPSYKMVKGKVIPLQARCCPEGG